MFHLRHNEIVRKDEKEVTVELSKLKANMYKLYIDLDIFKINRRDEYLKIENFFKFALSMLLLLLI